MDLRLAAAHYALGNVDGPLLVRAAAAALSNGAFSPALARLAYHGDPMLDAVAPLFEAALSELDLEVPGERRAALAVVADYARRVVLEAMAPEDAVRRIVREVFARWHDGRDRSLDAFVYWENEYDEAESAERRAECDAAVVVEARRFLERHPGARPW